MRVFRNLLLGAAGIVLAQENPVSPEEELTRLQASYDEKAARVQKLGDELRGKWPQLYAAFLRMKAFRDDLQREVSDLQTIKKDVQTAVELKDAYQEVIADNENKLKNNLEDLDLTRQTKDNVVAAERDRFLTMLKAIQTQTNTNDRNLKTLKMYVQSAKSNSDQIRGTLDELEVELTRATNQTMDVTAQLPMQLASAQSESRLTNMMQQRATIAVQQTAESKDTIFHADKHIVDVRAQREEDLGRLRQDEENLKGREANLAKMVKTLTDLVKSQTDSAGFLTREDEVQEQATLDLKKRDKILLVTLDDTEKELREIEPTLQKARIEVGNLERDATAGDRLALANAGRGAAEGGQMRTEASITNALVKEYQELSHEHGLAMQHLKQKIEDTNGEIADAQSRNARLHREESEELEQISRLAEKQAIEG